MLFYLENSDVFYPIFLWISVFSLSRTFDQVDRRKHFSQDRFQFELELIKPILSSDIFNGWEHALVYAVLISGKAKNNFFKSSKYKDSSSKYFPHFRISSHTDFSDLTHKLWRSRISWNCNHHFCFEFWWVDLQFLMFIRHKLLK